jgi:octaprenyl-diphosphate synthase
MALGTAFQVIDDALDYDGNAEALGKNLGDDLREGKVTLPLILAMTQGTAAQRELMREAIENGGTPHLDDIIGIVRSTGALAGTRQAAAGEARRAMAAAATLPDNDYRTALIQLSADLLGRQT